MLVCVNCNVEYEEERKFCKYCGEPLIPKIEPISTQKKVDRTEEEKSDEKLICPDCQIVYEFGSSCIQCGSALVIQIPPIGKEVPETDHKKPLQNLICPGCKIIYERGDSCIKCGSALVPQIPPLTEEEPRIVHKPEVEEKPIPLQTLQEQLIEAPRKTLVCPACKIIYERGNACVRCGVALVIQVSPQEAGEFKLSETPEADTEPPYFSSHQGQDLGLVPPATQGLEAVERVKKKEMEVTPASKAGVKEEIPQTETTEQQPTNRVTEDLERRLRLPKKRKIDYRRLSLEVGSITLMAVAGGYFLWSVYSYMITRDPNAKTPPPAEISSPVLPSPPAPTTATANVSIPQETDRREDAVVAETLETGKIKDLLENIRQANLQKNIDLFISCYATDFKDREEKKKATLAYWKKFDYLDLSYDLKNPSISPDTAKARVEWMIKISSKTGGQPQETKSILDVTFKKEEGDWKIKEVKQGA
jgi:rRNA maturation endonuclease Nob1/ketosteroid isomerase-like protein